MEFIYGGVVGVVQTLVGYPFDTLKTRIQTLEPRSRTLQDLKECFITKKFKETGSFYRGLFRGISYPMVSTCLITSNNFGLAAHVHQMTGSWLVGGFVSGFVSSFLIAPLELRKVKHQVGYPQDLIKTVPPYRGLGLTILRETPANAVYFSVYYYLHSRDLHAFWAGAAAGLASWTATYPLDVIKTRIQADPKITLKRAIGQGTFWKGFGLAASRAIIVNGTVFWLYDLLRG
jgi:hypothetical protein